MPIQFNPSPVHQGRLNSGLRKFIGIDAANEALRLLHACPAYQESPLRRLPALAARLGLASVHWKDESARLGLTSFKALGGAHAVFHRMGEKLQAQLGRAPGDEDWFGPVARQISDGFEIVTATAGNHGLSVAAGARVLGLRCIIYVSETVNADRRDRLARTGAEVRVEGSDFDASVRAAQRAALSEALQLVSDTAYDAGDEISGRVVQGYGVMGLEIIGQFARTNDAPPTHVFVQAGVGGLAASLAGLLHDSYGPDGPRIIVVEPELAPALHDSIAAGQAVRAAPAGVTNMDMLACYEPSAMPLAVLQQTADAFVTITDEDASAAMQRLAHPAGSEAPILASPTAAAGLASTCSSPARPAACERLQLDAQSRVLLIGSEASNAPPAGKPDLP